METLRARGWLGSERDLLTYSGYAERKLRRLSAALFDLSDVVISEPYRRDFAPAGLRGSSNQRLHRNTPLAQRRYAEQAPSSAPLEGAWVDGRILLSGVPSTGEMARFERLLRQAGLSVEDAVHFQE